MSNRVADLFNAPLLTVFHRGYINPKRAAAVACGKTVKSLRLYDIGHDASPLFISNSKVQLSPLVSSRSTLGQRAKRRITCLSGQRDPHICVARAGTEYQSDRQQQRKAGLYGTKSARITHRQTPRSTSISSENLILSGPSTIDRHRFERIFKISRKTALQGKIIFPFPPARCWSGAGSANSLRSAAYRSSHRRWRRAPAPKHSGVHPHRRNCGQA